MLHININKLKITTHEKELVNISFNIKDSTALIGESGSGKSLTLKALLNLLPSSLEVEKEFLKKNFNKKFGNPIQIMTTNKEIFEADKVAVTFADSDVDNFYGDATW